MAKTESTMLALGTQAPAFSLTDTVSGNVVHFVETAPHAATVIMFICNHCPFVKHVSRELARLGRDYGARNVLFLAINANNVDAYPDDSPALMKQTANEQQYPFPYLYDETQEVARAYQAACTPDFFIFDEQSKLVYRGQLDDSRPGNSIPVTGDSIRQALDCILSGQPVPSVQKPSIGCNIKWKP